MLVEFRERRREGEREGEKHQLVASHMCPKQGYNLGICPDWELNLQSFGLQDDTPTSWATPPRAGLCIFIHKQLPSHMPQKTDIWSAFAWLWAIPSV